MSLARNNQARQGSQTVVGIVGQGKLVMWIVMDLVFSLMRMPLGMQFTMFPLQQDFQSGVKNIMV